MCNRAIHDRTELQFAQGAASQSLIVQKRALAMLSDHPRWPFRYRDSKEVVATEALCLVLIPSYSRYTSSCTTVPLWMILYQPLAPIHVTGAKQQSRDQSDSRRTESLVEGKEKAMNSIHGSCGCQCAPFCLRAGVCCEVKRHWTHHQQHAVPPQASASLLARPAANWGGTPPLAYQNVSYLHTSNHLPPVLNFFTEVAFRQQVSREKVLVLASLKVQNLKARC
jgi:hypothetical protein